MKETSQVEIKTADKPASIYMIAICVTGQTSNNASQCGIS